MLFRSGAGKTILARQLGRWALQAGGGDGLARHKILPIWIDDEIASGTSIVDLVRRKLRTILQEEVLEEDIITVMLRKQRIMVIVDRLSEKSLATQKEIRQIFRNASINALVITSRTLIVPEGIEPLTLFPQPLNAGNVLRFMLTIIDTIRQKTEVTKLSKDDVSNLFSSPAEQLDLGGRLAKLFLAGETEGESSSGLFPLPVRLFVEESLELLQKGKSFDDLPVSLTDVYLRYVERVNPTDREVDNFIPGESYLHASMLVAMMALRGNFVPKEITKMDAGKMLAEAGYPPAREYDPLQRMLDNGLLIEKVTLGQRRVRFALDPVAEHLGAAWLIAKHDGNEVALKAEFAGACLPTGFGAALKLARDAWCNRDQ